MWNTIILNPMINALLWIYSLVGNFSIAIIVLITSYVQTRLMTPPQPGEQGAQMTRAMTLSMHLLMGYLALTFSSVLAIYFVISNVVAILQYGVLVRV